MLRFRDLIRNGLVLQGPTAATLVCVVMLAVLTLPGCGSSDGYKLVPVSGTITLDGQPLAGATISFQPSGGTAIGPGSAAVTDASGKYELKTSEADSRPGAVVGSHQVQITGLQDTRDPSDDTVKPMAKDPVPSRYRDPGLTFEVPADGTDAANFELQK